MRAWAPAGAIGVIAFAALGACSEPAGRACYPGGYQACDSAGGGYGACDCSGDEPWLTDAAADGAVSESCDGGTLGFLCPCDPSANGCGAGYECFSFPSKGAHCTKACSSSTDCPPPSPG